MTPEQQMAANSYLALHRNHASYDQIKSYLFRHWEYLPPEIYHLIVEFDKLTPGSQEADHHIQMVQRIIARFLIAKKAA